jgi:hypothetical protein
VIRTRAEQAVRDSADQGPRAQLEAYLNALTIGAQEHRTFYRVYLDFLGAGAHNAEIRKSTLSFILGCAVLEREVVARGIAAGVFRGDLEPAEAAYVVRALMDGLSIDWLFHDDEPFERFRRRLHEAVFGYLGA